MKKFFLMTIVAFATIMSTYAQTTQNPKGLYRLKQFIYEDGSTAPPNNREMPGAIQYIYAADAAGLTIFYWPATSPTQWGRIQIDIRGGNHPILNTGEKPQGPDGHGTQIFNVDDLQFYHKWYNSRWPRLSNLNEFITEVFTKENLQPEMVQTLNILEGKTDTKGNKIYGWWFRVAATSAPDGTGKRTSIPALWKAYSPEQSLVVSLLGNGNALQCNPTNTVKYENDSLIYEVGHPCNIHWLNDNCHALTFVQENGKPLTEIWVRSGLPKNWQNIFNTDFETYRNATECIKEAVDAATQGGLQEAEKLIAEAIEKDVDIQGLCMGIDAIVADLFTNKKQYNECMTLCERQLQNINDYVAAGHEHTGNSKIFVHQMEVFKAVATYRSGDTEKGKKMMEERLSIIDSEIEKYRAVKGMDNFINLLYCCNLTMFDIAYDALGADRTLLYLDALNLMAPAVTVPNKSTILRCRANCYLLKGDKESADKLLQQVEELSKP